MTAQPRPRKTKLRPRRKPRPSPNPRLRCRIFRKRSSTRPMNPRRCRRPRQRERSRAKPRIPGRPKMSPDVARYELVLKRLIAVTEAETSMLAFTRLMMPVPGQEEDPDFSRYLPQRF